jgi:hypothetical protein
VKTLRLVVRDDLDPSDSPNGDYRGAAKAERHPLDDRIRVWDAASRAIAMATTQRLQLGGCQGCHPGIVRRSRRTTSQSIPSVTDQATHNPRPIHHSRCDPSIAPTTKAIGPMVPAIPATSQNAQWAHGGCRSHGRRMETVFPTGWASSTEWLTVVISWPGGYAAARSARRFGRQGTPRPIRSRSHLATRGRPTGRPHRRRWIATLSRGPGSLAIWIYPDGRPLSGGRLKRSSAMSSNQQTRAQELLDSGGRIAWATVLEAREKWQSETPGLSDVKITSHMHLKLRVEPEGEPAFEASFGQALTQTVPITGWICKVVFDPADRSKIAMIDGTAVRPAAAPVQAVAPPDHSPVDQLTKLAELKDRGELTDAEFQSAKAKLLNEG